MQMEIGTYRPTYGRTKRGTFRSRFVARTKTAAKWGAFSVALGGIFTGIHFYDLAEAANTTTVVNQIVEAPKESMSVVMQRIADCESGDRLPNGRAVKGSARQFNKDGSIRKHINADGSVDVGYYMIHFDDHVSNIASQKLDILTEEGNKAYGDWLYKNIGTGPWLSSQHCWQ